MKERTYELKIDRRATHDRHTSPIEVAAIGAALTSLASIMPTMPITPQGLAHQPKLIELAIGNWNITIFAHERDVAPPPPASGLVPPARK